VAFSLIPFMQQLKIGIIGDFNFTFNTHHATNMALDHAGRFLEVEMHDKILIIRVIKP
jgi:hypothetical protein